MFLHTNMETTKSRKCDRANANTSMAAGSSSNDFGGHDDDRSMALALALQAEDDEALARTLMLEEEEREREHRQRQAGQQQQQQQQQRGPLPGERLAGAAHKSIQHLGKSTCKKIEAHFLKKQQTLTLAELLRIFRSERREEMLTLVDPGQRQRIEAELVAASLDFPPG